MAAFVHTASMKNQIVCPVQVRATAFANAAGENANLS